MRRISIAIAIALLPFISLSQEKPAKFSISEDHLNNEQIAVFRAALKYSSNVSERPLSLANRTEPLVMGPTADECLEGLVMPQTKASAQMSHTPYPAMFSKMPIIMVHRDKQTKVLAQGEGPRGPKGEAAYDIALFTISEIVFDAEHRHAVVAYGRYCGSLCGHGSLLVIEKVKQRLEGHQNVHDMDVMTTRNCSD